MANAQNTAQNNRQPLATAPKKLRLGKLFTDAPVRIEPEEPQKVLVAGMVEARPQKDYPDTFFGRAFKVLRGEFTLLLKASLIFLLFTVPFILIIAWFSGYFESLILPAGTYNFVSDIGVGYPGGGDVLANAVAALYWKVKEPVVLMVAASLIFGSIGFSGAFYAAKRSFYQDYYKKAVRTYFIGFAKYWWVFLLCSLVGVLIGSAISTATIHLLTMQTLSSATAGDYVAVVFSFVIGAPLMLIPMVTLSVYVTHELTLWQAFKNSLVLIANNWLSIFFVGALSCAPLALCIAGKVFSIIVYLVMGIVGSNLLALSWVAMASRAMTKCHVRLLDEQKAQLQAQRQQQKKAAKLSGNKKQKAQPKPYKNPKQNNKKKK